MGDVGSTSNVHVYVVLWDEAMEDSSKPAVKIEGGGGLGTILWYT